jgi:hypothetical protein
MFRTDLPKALREAIAKSKRSQNELAGAAEISQPVLSDFLSAKSDVYLATASKIATALGQHWPKQFFPPRRNNECSVGVVMAPVICGNRFCHLDWTAAESWVWTDFISGKRVRSAPPPNASWAKRTFSEMVAEITVWGPVPYWSKEDAAAWTSYLTMLTMGFTRKRTINEGQPNSAFGDWLPISE